MKARAAFLGTCLALAACNSPVDEAIKICEEDLLKDLRSPSTYSRISADSYAHAIEIDELQAIYLPDQISHIDRLVLDDLRKKESVQLERTTIIYDAANAYGTPIRGEKSCYGLRVGGWPYQVPQSIGDAQIKETLDESDRDFQPNGLYDTEGNFSAVIDCCLPLGSF